MCADFTQLEAALKQRGVRRVSLCFAPSVATLPKSAVVAGVQVFLDAYLSGRHTRTRLSDRPTASTAS